MHVGLIDHPAALSDYIAELLRAWGFLSLIHI